MINVKSISIPTPCSQSWQQMEITGNGRHCAHCAKIVVDFSKMTNDEILAFLAGTSNVCGRFNEFQLPNLNYQLDLENQPKRLDWKKWVAAVGLLGTALANRAMAQTTPANQITVQQTPGERSRRVDMLGKVAVTGTITQYLTGVVIGADDKLPVVGAYVKIKGTKTGIQTDTLGRFKLPNGGAPLVLVVSYIGYQTKELEVSTANRRGITITMQPSQAVLGEIVIIKTTSVQSRTLMLYQYMPWPINKLFK
ncbi:MAG TPA: carboxypeptidase-like regulatory domain-containing protein [Mucilaginibacter sp.]|nr:carboxypeptidase-like regulatory domain-containing protein [Mucilaginibacter sp.]